MSKEIRIDKEWIKTGNQKYKGFYIRYNTDCTFTAINDNDTFDYYIRESMADCKRAIDNAAQLTTHYLRGGY